MSSDDFNKFKKNATTLDYTIVPEDSPSNFGNTGPYFKLTYARGDKCIKRKDLICNSSYPNYSYDKCNKCCNLNNCICKNKEDRKKNKKICCEKDNCNCKNKNRKALVSFVHLTDIHIIDSCNSARSTFLGVFLESVPALADSFRSYESLSCQVFDCMIRKINCVEKGPHLKQKFSFAISTGDLSDSGSFGELQTYINILDGTTVVPNPASPGVYTGIQDSQNNPGYESFYHPDCNPVGTEPDMYKEQFGYPNYPGILDAACEKFCATGLKIPYYSCNGNHDVTLLGNFQLQTWDVRLLFDQIATGKIPDLGSKLITFMSPVQAELFIKALVLQDAKGVLDVINNSVLREVPFSNKREQFRVADFINTQFNSTKFPGVKGHGFTERNIQENVLYYTFKVADNITGIALDSCNINGNLENFDLAPNGSFGSRQVAFIEKELRKRHSNYFNVQGDLVCTDNKDELIILFFHHTIPTLNNIYNTPNTLDTDTERIDGEQFVRLLHRYPNVILCVNGHIHSNMITPYPNPNGKTVGIWNVTTASHIDFPQQSRIIEIAENSDDTLSIFCTMIDHQSPPNAERGCFSTGPAKNCNCSSSSNSSNCSNSFSSFSTSSEEKCSKNKESYTIEEMASISRELALNDPFINPSFGDYVTRQGTPLDRNVELLIFNPLKRCKSNNHKK